MIIPLFSLIKRIIDMKYENYYKKYTVFQIEKSKTEIFAMFLFIPVSLFIIGAFVCFIIYNIFKNKILFNHDLFVNIIEVIYYFIVLVTLSIAYEKKYHLKYNIINVILLKKKIKLLFRYCKRTLYNNKKDVLKSILYLTLILLFITVIDKVLLNIIEKNIDKIIYFIKKFFNGKITIRIDIEKITQNLTFNDVHFPNYIKLLKFLILAPIIEEYLYRYIYFKIARIKNAVILNSILFTLVHYLKWFSPLNLISTFFISYFFLSKLYYKKKKLLLTIINHFLINLYFYILEPIIFILLF